MHAPKIIFGAGPAATTYVCMSFNKVTRLATVPSSNNVGMDSGVRLIGGVSERHNALVESAHRAMTVVAPDSENNASLPIGIILK